MGRAAGEEKSFDPPGCRGFDTGSGGHVTLYIMYIDMCTSPNCSKVIVGNPANAIFIVPET